MGQQIKFSEENEMAFLPVLHSKHGLSSKCSSKSINIADTNGQDAQFKCCCKHSFKDSFAIGSHTCDLVPHENMKSVSINSSDLPPLPAFSTYNVSLSGSNNLKSDLWNVAFDKSELHNPDFIQVDGLDDCASQSCFKNVSSVLNPKLNPIDSTCQLESAGLNCTFPTDLSHCLANQVSQCTAVENLNVVHPDLDSDSCDMEIIKNYISDLDENFEEYSASSCEENSSSDYNLAELTTLGTESKNLFQQKSEHLVITFKGLTVATSNIKVSVYGNEKQYQCCECECIFTERYKIMSHLETHLGIKPFQCVICNEFTPCEAEACSHYEKHFSEDEFEIENGRAFNGADLTHKINSNGMHDNFHPCGKCNKTFDSFSALINHLEPHNIKPQDSSTNFNCSTCTNSFKSVSELECHHAQRSCGKTNECGRSKSMQKEKIENKCNTSCKERSKKEKCGKSIDKWCCEECNKTFRSSKALREHEVVHTGARDFPCDICGKAFGTGANMRIHRLTHSDIRPFSCQTCGATFRQKDSLKVHARKHSGERPYPCNMCEMTFDRSFTLKNHMLTHVSEKLFVCSICGKTFSTRGGLNNHERLHLKDPSLPKKLRGPRAKPGTGNWVCNECGKIYSTRSNLKMHQRTHLPSQISHVCPVCAKVYKSRDSMEVHMRTHSEQRPYKCPTCSRSFYRNYTLKLHILTHTGEKPHKCPVDGCDRSFAQTSSLAYHVRNHKKREERSNKKSEIKSKQKKHITSLAFCPEKNTDIVTNGDLMSLPLPGNCPPSDVTCAVPQHEMFKIGIGIDYMHPIVENIVLGDTHSGTHIQSTVDLSSNVDHQLGHVSTIVWEDNMSLMGIMNSANEQHPPPPLPHHSVEGNLHAQHCSQVQLMQLLPPEALPVLVTAPDPNLFHQDCTDRSIMGNQSVLL